MPEFKTPEFNTTSEFNPAPSFLVVHSEVYEQIKDWCFTEDFKKDSIRGAYDAMVSLTHDEIVNVLLQSRASMEQCRIPYVETKMRQNFSIFWIMQWAMLTMLGVSIVDDRHGSSLMFFLFLFSSIFSLVVENMRSMQMTPRTSNSMLVFRIPILGTTVIVFCIAVMQSNPGVQVSVLLLGYFLMAIMSLLGYASLGAEKLTESARHTICHMVAQSMLGGYQASNIAVGNRMATGEIS